METLLELHFLDESKVSEVSFASETSGYSSGSSGPRELDDKEANLKLLSIQAKVAAGAVIGLPNIKTEPSETAL